MVDYATWYPEAIALPSVDMERVPETLVDMFSHIGVPRDVLSDRGINFTSEIMKEVSCLLSLKQLHTTLYHPMAKGIVERFDGTLKQMIIHVSGETQGLGSLPCFLLYAYLEVLQESLRFSPRIFSVSSVVRKECSGAASSPKRAVDGCIRFERVCNLTTGEIGAHMPASA